MFKKLLLFLPIFYEIALHGELRHPGMFNPFKGMLYEHNDLNLEMEKNNSLPIVEIMKNTPLNANNFYSLCDAFHLKSKKKTWSTSFRDIRKTDLIVNTSICEQQNADMAKDR